MAHEALVVSSRAGAVLPALLAGVAVALQIGYPLTHGSVRDHLTVLIVAFLAGACLAHAVVSRSWHVALLLFVCTAVPGYLVEVLGVHTGFPFGSYAYTHALGPRVWGVPPIIGLAWTMLAWPAALAARRLVTHPVARIVVGAWGLAAADLFLDPQQVAAGHWTWRFPAPHLLGVATVPLTNYLGWFAVALAIVAAVQAIAGEGGDGVPLALYLWLYVGWIVALGAFSGLGAAAAWGALGMGLVAVPLAAGFVRR